MNTLTTQKAIACSKDRANSAEVFMEVLTQQWNHLVTNHFIKLCETSNAGEIAVPNQMVGSLKPLEALIDDFKNSVQRHALNNHKNAANSAAMQIFSVGKFLNGQVFPLERFAPMALYPQPER